MNETETSPFSYTFTRKADDDVLSVAVRFGCSPGEIFTTRGAGADVGNSRFDSPDARAAYWAKYVPNDGVELIVHRPKDVLPPGAEWTAVSIPEGAATSLITGAPMNIRLVHIFIYCRAVLATGKFPVFVKPKIYGRLVTDFFPHDTPTCALGLLRAVWLHWRNAAWRRREFQSLQQEISMANDHLDPHHADPRTHPFQFAKLKPGDTVWFPIFPFAEILTPIAACAAGDASACSASLELDVAAKWSRLQSMLIGIEQQLDEIDALANALLGWTTKATALLKAIGGAKEAMEKFGEERAKYASEDAKKAREKALKAADRLLEAGIENLLGVGAWTHFPGGNEAAQRLDTFKGYVRSSIANSLLLDLLWELYPTHHFHPVTDRNPQLGPPPELAVYVAQLGARVVQRLEEQYRDHDELLRLVRSTERASRACNDIIEVALLSRNGIEGAAEGEALDLSGLTAVDSLVGIMNSVVAAPAIGEGLAARSAAEAVRARDKLGEALYFVLGGSIGPLMKAVTNNEDWDADAIKKKVSEGRRTAWESLKTMYETVEGVQKQLATQAKGREVIPERNAAAAEAAVEAAETKKGAAEARKAAAVAKELAEAERDVVDAERELSMAEAELAAAKSAMLAIRGGVVDAAAERLEALLHPFKSHGEAGSLVKLMPPRLREASLLVTSICQVGATLSDIIAKGPSAPPGAIAAPAADATDAPQPAKHGVITTVATALSTEKAVGAAAQSSLEAAQAVMRMAKDNVVNAGFAEGLDPCLKVIGKSVAILGLVVDSVKVAGDLADYTNGYGDKKKTYSDLADLGGQVLFLTGTAAGGAAGGVVIAFGGLLFAGGFIYGHQNFVIKLFRGEAYDKFRQLRDGSAKAGQRPVKAQSSDDADDDPAALAAHDWADKCGFLEEYNRFIRAFSAASYDAFTDDSDADVELHKRQIQMAAHRPR